jgi:hypothetical protein
MSLHIGKLDRDGRLSLLLGDGMFLGSPLKLLTATRVAESQSAQRWVSLRSYPNESGPNHRCRAAGARARHVPTDDAVSETPGIRAGRFSHLCVARLASFRAMTRMCSSLLALHAIGDSGTQSSCKNVSTCKMFLLFCKRLQRSITFDWRMSAVGEKPYSERHQRQLSATSGHSDSAIVSLVRAACLRRSEPIEDGRKPFG